MERTAKDTTTHDAETRPGGYDGKEVNMFEVAWQEFNKADRLVTKRKAFKTEEAREKFINKLVEKDNFHTILAYR